MLAVRTILIVEDTERVAPLSPTFGTATLPSSGVSNADQLLAAADRVRGTKARAERPPIAADTALSEGVP